MLGVERIERVLDYMVEHDAVTAVLAPGAPMRFLSVNGEAISSAERELARQLAENFNLPREDASYEGIVTGELMNPLFMSALPDICCADFSAEKQTSFPYVLPGRGRFKIFLMYQRGVMTAVIKRTLLVSTDDLSERCRDLILHDMPGLHLVAGPSFDRNIDVAAKLVQFHAEQKRDSICFIGSHVLYNLRHGAGVVVQREVGLGADVPDYDKGLSFAIKTGFPVVATDVFTHDNLQMILQAVDHGIKIISTLRSRSVEEALNRLNSMLPPGFDVNEVVCGIYLPEERDVLVPGEMKI